MECRRFGLSTFWCVDVLTCRRFGLSTFWSVDVLVCRHFGLSTFWFVEVSVCRRFGLSTFWFVDVLVVDVSVCRRFDQLPTRTQGTIWNILGVMRLTPWIQDSFLCFLDPCLLTTLWNNGWIDIHKIYSAARFNNHPPPKAASDGLGNWK